MKDSSDNLFHLDICTDCKNTGRKAVKRKTISIKVIDYIVCPKCKNYEAFYKSSEKPLNESGEVIQVNFPQRPEEI
jgi:hypothetical protein